jgi:hypothetical protein
MPDIGKAEVIGMGFNGSWFKVKVSNKGINVKPIIGFGFDVIHGKGEVGIRMMVLEGLKLGTIESQQASVEMKINLFGISGLTVAEPRELFPIAEEKFNLPARIPR